MVTTVSLNYATIDELAGKLRLAACSSERASFQISAKNAILLARRIEDGRRVTERSAASFVVVNADVLESREAQGWVVLILTLLSISAFNDAAKFIAGLF